MAIVTNPIICDGCGLPASPEHITERLARLELATRFRPIHISLLLVALAPMSGPENDFYGPPVSKEIFNSLIRSARIFASPDASSPNATKSGGDSEKLIEFQHKGYYVAYLSECPPPADPGATKEAVSRLGANLVRRIRFNYKPKQIALLGRELSPLVGVLETAELGPILRFELGQPMPIRDAVEPAAGTGLPDALPTH